MPHQPEISLLGSGWVQASEAGEEDQPGGKNSVPTPHSEPWTPLLWVLDLVDVNCSCSPFTRDSLRFMGCPPCFMGCPPVSWGILLFHGVSRFRGVPPFHEVFLCFRGAPVSWGVLFYNRWSHSSLTLLKGRGGAGRRCTKYNLTSPETPEAASSVTWRQNKTRWSSDHVYVGSLGTQSLGALVLWSWEEVRETSLALAHTHSLAVVHTLPDHSRPLQAGHTGPDKPGRTRQG